MYLDHICGLRLSLGEITSHPNRLLKFVTNSIISSYAQSIN